MFEMNIQTERIIIMKRKKKMVNTAHHTYILRQNMHLNVYRRTGLRVMSLLIVIIIGVKLLLVIWLSFCARWSSHWNLVLVVFFSALLFFHWIALFQLLCVLRHAHKWWQFPFVQFTRTETIWTRIKLHQYCWNLEWSLRLYFMYYSYYFDNIVYSKVSLLLICWFFRRKITNAKQIEWFIENRWLLMLIFWLLWIIIIKEWENPHLLYSTY